MLSHIYEVMNPESIGEGVVKLKAGDLKDFVATEVPSSTHFVPAYEFCHTSPTFCSSVTSI